MGAGSVDGETEAEDEHLLNADDHGLRDRCCWSHIVAVRLVAVIVYTINCPRMRRLLLADELSEGSYAKKGLCKERAMQRKDYAKNELCKE